ncbi:AraC family transcriptional regulator [Vibrio sp. HN007]|uniref:AraC family transcriptional regulator n=1 Tax=Vibrio iocasae TaxID=3098914 RepID=UPI0035D50810
MNKSNSRSPIHSLDAITSYKIEHIIANPNGSNFSHCFSAEDNLLILITSGCGIYKIDGITYRLNPGTLLVISSFQLHHLDSSHQLEGFVISFDETELFKKDHLDCDFDVCHAINNINIVENIPGSIISEVYNLYDECNQNEDMVSPIIKSSLLRVIMYRALIRLATTYIPRIERKTLQTYKEFREAVEEHYKTHHNIKDYSTLLDTSLKKLNLACQKIKGKSAKKILDDRIIVEIKHMLAHTSKPITDISEELGYSESTNLAKFFKRATNITPSEYRNLSKNFTRLSNSENRKVA